MTNGPIQNAKCPPSIWDQIWQNSLKTNMEHHGRPESCISHCVLYVTTLPKQSQELMELLRGSYEGTLDRQAKKRMEEIFPVTAASVL